MWPFIRVQRKLLWGSVCCALIASGLWSVSMLLAFPVTKVLLEQQSLAEFLERQITRAEQQAARESARLAWLREQLDTVSPESEESLKLWRDQARAQRVLSDAQRQLFWCRVLQIHVLPWLPADRFHLFATLFLGLLLLSAVHGWVCYLQEVWIGRVVQAVLRLLRLEMFRHTTALDALTLSREGVPAVMSRFTNDLNILGQGLNLLGGKVLVEPLKIVGCLTAAWWVNWRLTLLSMLCFPAAAIILGQLGRRLKRAARRQMETMGRLYGVISEALTGIRVVKAYGQPRWHRRLLAEQHRAFYREALQINRLEAMVNPLIELLGVCAACLAILPAAYLVLRQKTTIWGIQLAAHPLELSEVVVLYSLLAGMLDPARKLASSFSRLRRSLTASQRIFEWLERESKVPQLPCCQPMRRHHLHLEFDQVTVSYDDAEHSSRLMPALQDVSLRIEFGEVVAIVGGNGSGKSTLVGLIPRFYDPVGGMVRLDGVDLRTWPLSDLRRQIGWVPQDCLLIPGTIAENIALGKPRASAAEVERAAELAAVLAFTRDWPQGLETPIGVRGQQLSGGQRQRIALARAIIRDPALLILDEATSAIDTHSEQLVYQTLRQFCQGRTTLIITHTLTPTLLAFVTRVAYLDKGRLVAFGPHEDLLRICPPYARLAAAHAARRAA